MSIDTHQKIQKKKKNKTKNVGILLINNVMIYFYFRKISFTSRTKFVTMATAAVEGGGDRQFLTYDGPKSGVNYPIKVLYCGGNYFYFSALISFDNNLKDFYVKQSLLGLRIFHCLISIVYC